MSVKIQPNTLQDVLKWEQANRYSRADVTVLSGEILACLEVIGKQALSVPTTGTADGGNTGDGLCDAVAGGALTKVETITLVCIAAAANGGTFSVVADETGRLADATVGVAYVSKHINFMINDGAADFIVGDKFTIAVTAGSGKVVALDFSAVDGSQRAAGFMTAACDATGGDTQGVAIIRDCLIVPDDLIWPVGATADQKTAALAELADLGFVLRQYS